MLNKVILIGRLGRDPESRYTSDNILLCRFSLATDEVWRDKNGIKQQRTEWHNVIAYRRLAEIAGQYLRKGSPVYIEGKIQSRKYQGRDGIERTAFDIVVSELKMLGRTDKSEAASPPPASAPAHAQNKSYAELSGALYTPPSPPKNDLRDNDIPF